MQPALTATRIATRTASERYTRRTITQFEPPTHRDASTLDVVARLDLRHKVSVDLADLLTLLRLRSSKNHPAPG